MVGRGLRLGSVTRAVAGVLGVVCLVAMSTGGASAWDRDDHRGPPPRYREAPPPPRRHWEPPPSRYHHHAPRWEDGRWWRGPHHGRVGWWWIVGDRWYSFRMPIHPFPPAR